MEEYDLAVFDRQAHSCGAAGLCQRPDNCSDGFGTMGIIDDSHPFFQFTAFVPSSVLKVAKAGTGQACVQFRCRQHSHVRGVTQLLDCVLQI